MNFLHNIHAIFDSWSGGKWAVTARNVAGTAKPGIMITRSPGHMSLTDIPDETLAVG